MKKLTLAQRGENFQQAAAAMPVKPKTVYYHSFRTCIMSCSPFAIFQELMADEEFSDWEHVWVYGSGEALAYDTFSRYADAPNVKYVEAGSYEQAEALATCQYLITNAGLPTYWQKREGQVVINTWHGTPLKSLGKDARDFNGSSIGNAQRNFLLSDYLVMPNRYTADRLLDSYCIDSLFRGKILDVGSPRVDAVLNSDHARTRALLEEKYGSSLEGKKIVLYGPTFRSEEGKSVNTADVMAEHMRELVEGAPEDYIVFFKVHNTLGKYFVGNAIMESRLIFDEIETNELLGVTDVLITDYSSIFFDFICTGRPILFFVYDKERYAAAHGMYLDTSDMPGTECFTTEEVAARLEDIEAGTYRNPNMDYALEMFANHDDGRATKRTVDIIFRGLPGEDGQVDDRSTDTQDGEFEDVLISLESEPRLSAARALAELLHSLDPARQRVTIAAHNVHLIWKECERTFPSARIIFSDTQAAAELCTGEPTRAYLLAQFASYFPGMAFDAYYNLKPEEGFIDRMLDEAMPDIQKHWHLCWSDKLKGAKIAKRVSRYQDTVVYCDHQTALPDALVEAGVTVVTDLDLRNRPHHRMTVLLIASFDSMNHVLAQCAKRIVEDGNLAFVTVAKVGDLVNTRMFLDAGLDIVPIKAVDDASLTFMDMAVGSPLKAAGQTRLYRHIVKHNLMVFSFCNLFSSVAMRTSPDIVFTLGEAKNEELRAYNLRYNCVAVGNPQYDALLELEPANVRAADGSPIREVLVVEQGGYPYGEKGKRQLADMLLRIARENPDLRFTVKPRYLPDDLKGSIHGVSEHVYDFLDEHPENLVLMHHHCTIEEIIGDYDAMITMWSTAFLDAMMMDMPLLLVGGFDSVDVFDVRSQRIQEAYDHLQATGCLKRFDEVGANIADDFKIVDPAFAEHEVFDYRNPSTDRTVRFLELAYETLVKPNLRIQDEFSTTETGYYEIFDTLNLVSADTVQYRAWKRYRAFLNNLLQEAVYRNRCMGAVLDLSGVEKFYDEMPPAIEGAAMDRYLDKFIKRFEDAFEAAEDEFFESDEGMEKVEADRILQDFYFDWLYKKGKRAELKNPPLENVLAPESREYNLALAALSRAQLPAAYDHLFAFLRMTKEQPIIQLLKCKRIRESIRPFKQGPLQAVFFAELLKKENEPTIDLVYKEPDRMPIVALSRARALNAEGRYEDCVVFCDMALLHHSAKGKRDKNPIATARMYVKKVFYRGIAAERQKAADNAKREKTSASAKKEDAK